MIIRAQSTALSRRHRYFCLRQVPTVLLFVVGTAMLSPTLVSASTPIFWSGFEEASLCRWEGLDPETLSAALSGDSDDKSMLVGGLCGTDEAFLQADDSGELRSILFSSYREPSAGSFLFETTDTGLAWTNFLGDRLSLDATSNPPSLSWQGSNGSDFSVPVSVEIAEAGLARPDERSNWRGSLADVAYTAEVKICGDTSGEAFVTAEASHPSGRIFTRQCSDLAHPGIFVCKLRECRQVLLWKKSANGLSGTSRRHANTICSL